MFSSENNRGVNYTEQLRGGGAANQEPDSPKRRELSSKERNHPSADRAVTPSPFQVTRDTPSPPPLAPHLAPSAPCAPTCAPILWHRCPSWGQILSSPSCALSPACSVLSHTLRLAHLAQALPPCAIPLLSGHPHALPRALTPSTLPPHTLPTISFPTDALAPCRLQPCCPAHAPPEFPSPWSSQNTIYLCVEVKAALFIAWDMASPLGRSFSPSRFHLGI